MHNRRIVWFQFHLCILMTFQTQQVCALKKWPKITANHTNLSLTHVNISNVNIQFGTKRAHQETKYVASKNNGLEAGCKVQHKYSKILFKSHIIKIAAVSKAFLLFPQSLEAVKSLNSFRLAQMDDTTSEICLHQGAGKIMGDGMSYRQMSSGERDHFSYHRNQSHQWRRVTHPLWRSRRCRRSPAVWSGFLRSHAERSPGTRRPTCRNSTPSHRLCEDTQWPSF